MRMKARMRKTRTPGSAPPLVHLRAFVLLASAFGGQFLLFQLQLSSGFELHHLLGGDFDGLLGGGVDARATGTLGHGECAEAYQSYFVTLFHGVCHDRDESVQRLLGVCLGEGGLGCHVIAQFTIIHTVLLL